MNPAERMAFWTESERLLADLLRASSTFLVDEEQTMIQSLIDHNEHQLALEFLFDYLDQNGGKHPAAVASQFSVLVDRLGMTGNRELTRLGTE